MGGEGGGFDDDGGKRRRQWWRNGRGYFMASTLLRRRTGTFARRRSRLGLEASRPCSLAGHSLMPMCVTPRDKFGVLVGGVRYVVCGAGAVDVAPTDDVVRDAHLVRDHIIGVAAGATGRDAVSIGGTHVEETLEKGHVMGGVDDH